jgi:hypothetical protein
MNLNPTKLFKLFKMALAPEEPEPAAGQVYMSSVIKGTMTLQLPTFAAPRRPILANDRDVLQLVKKLQARKNDARAVKVLRVLCRGPVLIGTTMTKRTVIYGHSLN